MHPNKDFGSVLQQKFLPLRRLVGANANIANLKSGVATILGKLSHDFKDEYSAFQKNLADGVAFVGKRSKKPISAISATGKCIRAECLLTETLNKTVTAPRLGRSYIC